MILRRTSLHDAIMPPPAAIAHSNDLDLELTTFERTFTVNDMLFAVKSENLSEIASRTGSPNFKRRAPKFLD